MAEYDAIADEYAASKLLPWRVQVEQPTLFGLIGDACVLKSGELDGFRTFRGIQVAEDRCTAFDLTPAAISTRATRHPPGWSMRPACSR